MVTFSSDPPGVNYRPPSLRQARDPADIVIKCDGQTFEAHKSIVFFQSQKLRDACDASTKVSAHQVQSKTREADKSEQQDATVVIHEDEFDAPTTKRMLDFLYHGEYDIGTAQESATGDEDNNVTYGDVVSHLMCYAIAENYQIKQLMNQALNNFSECLSVVSPDDFAKLMGNLAACSEEKLFHDALRNAASSRQDQLAACKSFTETLGCEHIIVPASQDPGQTRDLKTAKQLAVHGAKLFRIANHTAAVANVEKTKLVKAYQTALKKIDQLRAQVDKGSSTLVLDERVHNDAKDALLASETAAQHARDELLASEERASRMAQANQKMKLEMEVLRNAEHNNKLALEKANKEAAIPRLALEERLEGSNVEMTNLRATLQASLEANSRHATNEQRMAAEIQRLTKSHEQTTAELAKVKVQRNNAVTNSQGASRGTTRVKNEFIALQKTLTKVIRERDQAGASLEKAKQDHACTSEDFTLVTKELTYTLQHRDRAITERDRAITERDQATAEQASTAQMLDKANRKFATQFNQVMAENIALEKAKEERDQAVEEQKRTSSKLEKADRSRIRQTAKPARRGQGREHGPPHRGQECSHCHVRRGQDASRVQPAERGYGATSRRDSQPKIRGEPSQTSELHSAALYLRSSVPHSQ
jgi:hypothetical protein